MSDAFFTRDNVLQAVRKIESEKTQLIPSFRYLVEVDGKHYPPKELARYATEVATGTREWHRHGGHYTNKVFEELGFTILSKREAKIDALIARYNAHVAARGLSEEYYKWDMVEKYRGRPNVDAVDFKAEVTTIDYNNMAYQLFQACRRDLVTKAAVEYKEFYRDLFNEEIDLVARVTAFTNECNELFHRVQSPHSSHHDERAISSILTCYNPDKYFFYKNSFYRAYCKHVGIPHKTSNKFVDYLELMQNFVDEFLSDEKGLIDLVTAELAKIGKAPFNINVMAQDILYTMFDAFTDAPEKKVQRVWRVGTRKNGSEWPHMLENGIASIGWNDIGDLREQRFERAEEIALLLTAHGNYIDQKPQLTKKSKEIFDFFETADEGDIIVAQNGHAIVGIGVLDGEYEFKESGTQFHQRSVEWLVQPEGLTSKAGQLTTFEELTDKKFMDKIRGLVARAQEGSGTDADAFAGKSVAAIESNDEANSKQRYWWLNADPKIWSMVGMQIGQLQSYSTHNERGNKRMFPKNYQEIKPGDFLVGYETTPLRQIKAVFKLTKRYLDSENGEHIEFKLIEKLLVPVNWAEVKSNEGLKNCEVVRCNNQGSLLKLTDDEYDIIRELIDNKNIVAEREERAPRVPYSFATDQHSPFIDEQEFNQIVELLRDKKNIILQGPPGVGKTFLARKVAYAVMGEVRDTNIEMVQFHQSYSYEDFIQGLRPNSAGGFTLRNGTFYTFCRRALSHPEREYFFIIDEINRGNLSKILGEVMMLIEHDKRSSTYALKLTYAEDEADTFFVPANVHIIGSMNTADRSLAIVDYALRRRFMFITLEPNLDVTFSKFLKGRGVSDDLVNHICTSVNKVNKVIKDDSNLGSGLMIGHSYFCDYKNGTDEETWWNNIVEFELLPLLKEIWFDSDSTVSTNHETLKR